MLNYPSKTALTFSLLFTFSFLISATEKSEYVLYNDQTIAIANVMLVDGSGSLAKLNQTIIIENGRIKASGNADQVFIPETATRIDGKGKTLLPGLVMMHEHMFYPTGKANYTEMLHSFPKLYLAGGATTIRTAGTTAPYADLNLRDAIQAGKLLGPDMDVTAPYLNGPGLPTLKINVLGSVADAERMTNYWADEGVTSYKAYMHISREELAKVIEVAHQRNHKVTAHLCSVTYREAANLGIDNLEHGFVVMSDFVQQKEKDKCPLGNAVPQSIAGLDITSAAVKSLIQLLVDKNVTITSTLTIFETYAPGRPKAYPEALDTLIPQVRKQYEDYWQKIQDSEDKTWAIIFTKIMQLERMFVEAGGKLIVGTDPTGYGGVIAGFSNQRAIELLVEAGFSFEQAINFSSLEGARYLGNDHEIGSVKVGKRANLILVKGNPVKHTSDIRNIQIVFKDGIGFDSRQIVNSMKETVGLH